MKRTLFSTACRVVSLTLCLIAFAFSGSSRAAEPADIDAIVDRAVTILQSNYLYASSVDIEVCRKELKEGLSNQFARERELEISQTPRENETENEAGPIPVANQCLDRYSEIETPRAQEEFTIRARGELGGIGVAIAKNPQGEIAILSLFEHSPAARAGMEVGDVLLKVRSEGEESFSEVKNLSQAVSKIRGPKGTKVYLVIRREAAIIELPAIERDIIKVSSVASKVVDRIGYVHVKSFSETTADEFEDEVAALLKKGVDRIVVDLRDNTGGVLPGALEMLYYFSDKADDVILTVRTRDSVQTHTIRDPTADCPAFYQNCQPFVYPQTREPKTPGRFKDLRMAVLTNKMSASASEIFVGTLKDWSHNRSTVALVGAPTFGKGVGQTIFGVSDGFGFRLTTFEFLVGNGKTPVNDVGILPHYIVDDTRQNFSDTTTDRDAQWKQAVSILREMQ